MFEDGSEVGACVARSRPARWCSAVTSQDGDPAVIVARLVVAAVVTHPIQHLAIHHELGAPIAAGRATSAGFTGAGRLGHTPAVAHRLCPMISPGTTEEGPGAIVRVLDATILALTTTTASCMVASTRLKFKVGAHLRFGADVFP
ncbi:MAG: hypothetical protein H6643_12055 [Caldilineaceae bacterium]|nr:hypothetical protein [Caldilineaceae bacterium]